MNFSKFGQSILALLLLALMAGCANNQSMYAPPPMGEQEIRYGVVIRIDPMTIQSKHQFGLGAVMGAAAGGLLGSAIGQGSGRDVAMVLGAIGGGLFGSDEQAKMDAKPGMHVMVKLDFGPTVAVTQLMDPALRVGDRVMIQGSGPTAQVSPHLIACGSWGSSLTAPTNMLKVEQLQ